MAYERASVVVSIVAATCLLSTEAAATVQSKCLASKNKCMSKKAGSLLKCHEKAETPGKPNDPNFADCETKAKGKFDGGVDPSKGCFEKLENKTPNDCVTFNDTGSAEASVENCVAEIIAALDPGSTQSKCDVGKKKCVAKKLKGILKCHQKAETPGQSMDPNFADCITKARDKYSGGADPTKGCFAKLEAKTPNDCSTTGNSVALEAIVDDSCVAAFLTLLNTPTTTTTSSTSTTTSTTHTTTTSTTSSTTTSTTSTTTSSTTTTTMFNSALPAFLDFTVTAGSGNCGETKDGSNTHIKFLGCGGLDIGAGASLIPEGPTPDGSISRYSASCLAPNCSLSATSVAPGVNTAAPDCTNTGCNFGTPLPIPNPTIPGITSCVLNTLASPGGGTLNISTGAASFTANLSSDTYLTGNLGQPCPKCSATGSPASPGHGSCDRGPRATMPCTTTSSTGYTRDCPTGGADGTHPCTPGGGACIDGSHVGVINVNLSPLGTGTSVLTDPGGSFCPGQSNMGGHQFGCFGSTACRTITENGSAAGVTPGVPSPTTLASTFCIGATGNGLVDASADLPGPGAVSLPGTFNLHN